MQVKIFCTNGDVISVEPDPTMRELTHNQDAALAIVYRKGQLFHAESCSDMQAAVDKAEVWTKLSGGPVLIAAVV